MNKALQYKGYLGKIEFSYEDNVFFGTLIGINDLITFEGESVKELVTAFHEAVDDYLETCKEIGKEPNKTYKGSFNVRVPYELHRDASLLASAHNITLNEVVKIALKKVVANEELLSTND